MKFGRKFSLRTALEFNGLKKSLSLLSSKSFDLDGIRIKTPSPRMTMDAAVARSELTILTALKGGEVSSEERQRCSSEINLLTGPEKTELIEFVRRETAGVVENNAMKMFETSELTSSLLQDHFHVIVELWEQLTSSACALQGICYGLELYDPEFKVKKQLMIAFRDRVLVKILCSVDEPLPELESILFSVNLEAGPTEELDTIIGKCLGKEEQAVPIRKDYRSKSVPSKRKSVTWLDDRKSSTFSG